jgi:hypothetical protein
MKRSVIVFTLTTLMSSTVYANGANNNCNGNGSCPSNTTNTYNQSTTNQGGLALAGANSNASSTSSAIGVGLGISNSSSQALGGNAAAQGGKATATGGVSNVTSAGGNSNNNVNIDNDTRMPASPAISPSVGTASDCQIATPSSKALSILLISVSGTTGVTYNDVCFAYKMGQLEVAEKLMCEKSQAYAKANPNCSK